MLRIYAPRQHIEEMILRINWLRVLCGAIGALIPMLWAVMTAYASDCPLGGGADCDTAASTAQNPLIPILAGVAGTVAAGPAGRFVAGFASPALGSVVPGTYESPGDENSEENRCRKLKEEYQNALNEYRGYDNTIGEVESTWIAYRDSNSLIKSAEQALHETDVWMRLYYTFGYAPQKVYEGLKYLVDSLTNAGMVLSPALAFGGTMSVGKMATLLARLTGLSAATITTLSGGFSAASFGVAAVAYAGTSQLPNHAANIAAQAAAVRAALTEAYGELDRLADKWQDLKSNYGSAPLSSADQQIRYDQVNNFKFQLQATCPNTVLVDSYVPFVRGLRPDWASE